MPNTREKLIELVDNYTDPLTIRDIHKADFSEKFADHLIANGVTVQKWIPVTERLPEKNGIYLTSNKKKQYQFICFEPGKMMWKAVWKEEDVTHWMPMPEPPKEGD